MIRQKVGEICDGILEKEDEFQKRGDREWVLMTLAEVCQGLERPADEKRLAPGATTPPAEADEALDETEAPAESVGVLIDDGETQTVAPTVRRSSDGEIVIDANIAPGRTIKSIDVTCKIEYS